MANKVIYIRNRDEGLYKEAEEFCSASGVSLSSLIASLLEEYFKAVKEESIK